MSSAASSASASNTLAPHGNAKLVSRRSSTKYTPGDKALKVDTVCEGYLEKKSPKSVLGRHAWQKRYFVLTLTSFQSGSLRYTLYYYRSAEERNAPLGLIEIDGIKSIDISREKNGRFDVVVEGRTYSLRTDNSADMKKWTDVLADVKEKEKRLAKKPEGLPDNAFDTMKMMANATPATAKLFAADDTIEVLSMGIACKKYDLMKPAAGAEADAEVSIIMFWYNRDKGALGTLFYNEPGVPTEEDAKSIALADLSDLFIGKHSRTFKSVTGARANGHCVFTIATRTKEWNLEVDTKEQITSILFSINTIMVAQGGRKVVNAEDAKAAPAASGSTSPKSPRSPHTPRSPSSPNALPQGLGAVKEGEDEEGEATPRGEEEGEEKNGEGRPVVRIRKKKAKGNSLPHAMAAMKPKAAESEVGVWLLSMGAAYSTYVDPFYDNGVNMAFLLTLTDDDLQELGVVSAMHRRKILQAVEEMKERNRKLSSPIEAANRGADGSGALSKSPKSATRVLDDGSVPAAPTLEIAVPDAPTAPDAPATPPSRQPSLLDKAKAGGFLLGIGPHSLAALRSVQTQDGAPANAGGDRMNDLMEEMKKAKLKTGARPTREGPKRDVAEEQAAGTIAQMAMKLAQARKKKEEDAKKKNDVEPAASTEAAATPIIAAVTVETASSAVSEAGSVSASASPETSSRESSAPASSLSAQSTPASSSEDASAPGSSS